MEDKIGILLTSYEIKQLMNLKKINKNEKNKSFKNVKFKKFILCLKGEYLIRKILKIHDACELEFEIEKSLIKDLETFILSSNLKNNFCYRKLLIKIKGEIKNDRSSYTFKRK